MNKYDSSLLSETIITHVHKKKEGTHWDFKQKWHENKARLLHDILCMANNLADEDGFIIIGVQDDGVICGTDVDDVNRRKQADIIDWLSHMKFAGDIPDVQVYHDVEYSGVNVDVIVILQKNNGPYFLKERYSDQKTFVLPVVYTRVGDTNTPINESASFSQIETLWRKRLGLLYDVQQKALKYVYDLDNWEFIDSNEDEGAVWYYKGDPAYTISTISDDIERSKSILFEFYYLCTFLNVGYHPGIEYERICLRYNNLRLFEDLITMVDECRTLVLYPDFGCFVKGTIRHGLYEFIFAYMCGNYSSEAKRQIERVVPIYESEEERKNFEAYAKSIGWSQFSSASGDHTGEFKRNLDKCKVDTPKVVGGFAENGRNIEQLQTEQESGALFNFYNEEKNSESEKEEISRRIKEGFTLVRLLSKWRTKEHE